MAPRAADTLLVTDGETCDLPDAVILAVASNRVRVRYVYGGTVSDN